MSSTLKLPLLEEVLPNGLNYGANYLVEFEPQSLWFETSFSLVANALRGGYKADYHTFTRPPDDVRSWLERFGLDLTGLERDDTFRIWDSYTVQTGVGAAARIGSVAPRERIDLRSVKIADWDKGVEDELKGEIPEIEKNRLHLDDNTSVLLQYNDERLVVEHFRTRTIPYARRMRMAAIHSLLIGAYSDTLYKHFESFCDGIIDFKTEEVGGKLTHLVRVRAMRGAPHDSSWRRLRLLETGEVAIDRSRSRVGPTLQARSTAPETGETGGPEANDAFEARRLLASTNSVSLENYRVAGKYMRFDAGTRNTLKDARQRIVASLAQDFGVENFLLWGVPGSGKSYFVQEVARQLSGKCHYTELNLAQLDEAGLRGELAKLSSVGGNVMVFVDEIDSKPMDSWQYEALLPVMEKSRPGARTSFVLAGSGGSSMRDLRNRISERPKGPDLLSRIPQENDLTIPQLSIGDKMVVAMVQLIGTAREKGRDVREVEKLALLYVMMNERLSSPRVLRQFVQAAAERIPAGEDRVKYDYLFRAGDPLNKEFWVRSKEAHRELANQFVRVVDLAEQLAPVGAPETLEGEKLRRVEEKNRIAVLPFLNISQDPSDEYFADGMTEELISAVSKIGDLRVIARTSVMRYKGKDKPAGEIGKELGVGSLLEGSVRKQGNKVRINVQLVDAANEEPRWSAGYDRELQNIFAIQRDISQKVAEALKVHVLKGEFRVMSREATRKPEAFVQYLKGRQFWNKRTKGDLEEAVQCFERALKIDPTYAKAYTGLADTYATLASYALEFISPTVAFPQARASIQKALELDPDLAEAHTSLGLVKFQYDWDWQGAEEEFKKAINLERSYSPAHQFFADYLKAMGRFDEALEEIVKAQELDPLSSAISVGVGHVLYLSRQYDEAIKQYMRAVELDPNFMQTHMWFGRPYLEKGMYAEAIAELETAVKLSGESTVALAMLGHGLASAGRKEEALEILGKLKERSKEQYVPSYWIAVIYNGLKERDQVIAWLHKAFDERSSWLVWANTEPRFDWLRKDPDFEALMKAMKFP